MISLAQVVTYNNNMLHLYSAFLCTQSALHSKGLYPHPPPVCSIHLDDATAAILHQNAHHTPVERRQSDEANQCMGMIRRPWWSEDNGHVLPGCRGCTLLFLEGHPGIFNDHKESGPQFNISSEGRCFLTLYCPRHYTGALGPTQTEHLLASLTPLSAAT